MTDLSFSASVLAVPKTKTVHTSGKSVELNSNSSHTTKVGKEEAVHLIISI